MKIMGYTPEEIELQLIKVFLKNGHSRNCIEMVGCWEHANFTREQRATTSFIRARMIVNNGLMIKCQAILEKGIDYVNERKALLEGNTGICPSCMKDKECGLLPSTKKGMQHCRHYKETE